MQKKSSKKLIESQKNFDVEFAEDIVADVMSDFERRSTMRRSLEAQWQLNANFFAGNQYCRIGVNSEIETADKEYYWQEREVFNHIAAIMESRLAKLSRVRPKMSVRPSSADDGDVKTGKMASKILSATYNSLELDKIISSATLWSELCGSAFYKVVWDSSLGAVVGEKNGKKVREGDVRIDVCSPYEIYPDSIYNQDLDEVKSVIHAKAVSIEEIKQVWGVDVSPESVDTLAVMPCAVTGGLGVGSVSTALMRSPADAHAMVIERYTKPSYKKENGELAIVAGGKLLYYGELPFANGEDGKRDLPFIKQESLTNIGCFFGTSVIERVIPIQRAYNAVKNRKHEFMNRIAMGVMAVEDGSVDMDNLADEGLSPGKIIVYRQGSTPPRLLDSGRVPSEFTIEEERLLNEFMTISGVSEIMRSSRVPSTVTSGVAISMLIDQDDTRLTITAEKIRRSIRRLAKHILRLYKQLCPAGRLSRCVGDNGEVELIYWNKSDITCDDVVFDTENEINSTPAARQSMMFDLLRMGLLHDENGKLSDATRYKILDMLGYGGWEITKDTESLNASKAAKENMKSASSEPLEVSEIDSHDIHISEHVKFALSPEFEKLCQRNARVREKLINHIREHKQFSSLNSEAESGGLNG